MLNEHDSTRCYTLRAIAGPLMTDVVMAAGFIYIFIYIKGWLMDICISIGDLLSCPQQQQ